MTGSRIMRFGALGLVGLIIIFTLLGSFYSVEQGERAVLTRFGKIVDIQEPGLHFKTPWIESVHLISVRVQTLEWAHDNPMESYSKDQQPAKISVKLSYHALPDAASIEKLYSQYRDIEGFSNAVLIPRAYEGIKTTFGKFNAVTAVQERTRLNQEVEAAVRALVGGSPVFLDGVQIQDISYSDAYETAVEARMTSQVEVEKVQQNKAREQLQADIRVIQATAAATAVRLNGDAEAYAIEKRAQALKANQELVAYTAVQKWNGALPTTQVPGP